MAIIKSNTTRHGKDRDLANLLQQGNINGDVSMKNKYTFSILEKMNRLDEFVYLWFPLADEVLQVECVTVKYNSTHTCMKTSMTDT